MNKKLLWGGIATVTGILIAGALLPAILSFVCKTEKTVLVHDQKFVFQDQEQMKSELSSLAVDLFDRQVTVTYGDNNIVLSGEEIGAGYDCETTAQEIEEALKARNFWERFYSCYLPKPRFDLAMVLDTKQALEKLWALGYREGNEAAYPSYVVEGEQLLITAGSGKNVVDEPKALKDLLIELEAQTGKAVSLSVVEQATAQLGIPQILELVTQDPKDAHYSEETGQIIPHQVGIKGAYDPILSSQFLAVGAKEPVAYPLKITLPEITTEDLQQKLFRDLLGTHTSNYNAGQISRSHNVALAASKLHNRVFKEGEIISYNDLVGQRTAAAGFQAATVYVGNKLEQGIGGGICQVSSTLYAAALRAGLEVVERVNHSMPVSYMPAGMDATVSYGSIDLKLKNNTSYPIRVEATAVGGKMTVNIYGTREDPTYDEIVIFNEAVGSIPFTVVEEPVDWLKVGESRTIQNGTNGGIYRVYQQYRLKGETVKTLLANKSTYHPTPKIVQVGTFPVETPPAVEPAEPIPPVEPVEPTTPVGPVAPIVPIEPPAEEEPPVVLPVEPELLPDPVGEEFVQI
ncbi:MAG: VanW family protein [Clostridia bacterium]|nr:VanW family protein [Clostridia bacterium]